MITTFYIPLLYIYRVRLQRMDKLLSWLFIFLMPTAFYSLYNDCHIGSILNYILVLLAVISLYELGYMLNDTYAIRREVHPTLRLTQEQTRDFYKHSTSIILTRILYATIALAVYWFVSSSPGQALITTIAVFLIVPIFLLYNYWRRPTNVLLYPVLVYSRFLPLVLANQTFVKPTAEVMPLYMALLLLFLSYPFEISLERLSMPHYRFAWMKHLLPDEHSKVYFRIIYYLVFSIMLSFLLPYSYLLPFYLFLIYRTILTKL